MDEYFSLSGSVQYLFQVLDISVMVGVPDSGRCG